MAYLPENAMSELVLLKRGGCGVCESSLRLVTASPASWRPALSPTRGSGRVAAGVGVGAWPGVDLEPAHAARASSPTQAANRPTDTRAPTPRAREGNATFIWKLLDSEQEPRADTIA